MNSAREERRKIEIDKAIDVPDPEFVENSTGVWQQLCSTAGIRQQRKEDTRILP